MGTSHIIGNLMRIRVASAKWTWIGSEWPLTLNHVMVDVNDVAPPTINLSDAKRHASLLSTFLLENSLYFGFSGIINFQKLVG